MGGAKGFDLDLLVYNNKLTNKLLTYNIWSLKVWLLGIQYECYFSLVWE